MCESLWRRTSLVDLSVAVVVLSVAGCFSYLISRNICICASSKSSQRTNLFTSRTYSLLKWAICTQNIFVGLTVTIVVFSVADFCRWIYGSRACSPFALVTSLCSHFTFTDGGCSALTRRIV